MKTGPDFPTETKCPHCGHKLDTGQLSPADPESGTAIPKANDLGVCIECGGFLIYTDDHGSVRAMTPKDMAGASKELIAELMDIRLNILKMHGQHRHKR